MTSSITISVAESYAGLVSSVSLTKLKEASVASLKGNANEVLGLACIGGMNQYTEAINIVIEKLEVQPFIDEVVEEQNCHSEAVS